MKDTGSHSQAEANGADDIPHYANRRRRRRGRDRDRDGHRPPSNKQGNGDIRPMLLDTWALTATVLKRWYWLLLGGLICAGLAGFAGWTLWQPYYVATSQLIRSEQQNSAEFFKYQLITPATFVSILQSPELIHNVARKAVPIITPEDLKQRLMVAPERDSDIVSIEVTGESAQRAVDLANLYATQAIEFFQKMQQDEAGQAHAYLTNQLRDVEKEIANLTAKLRVAPSPEARKSVGPDLTAQRLAAAEQELTGLLGKFTEQHPDVIAKTREVQRLRELVKKSLEDKPVPENKGGGIDEDAELLRARLSMLMNSKILLDSRVREAAQFANKPPGYCREFALAETKDARFVDPKIKIIFLGVVGGIAGIGGTILLILLFELFDNRLKTVADLKRVTRLPVIATLGNLDKMHPTVQSGWAFRTWTALQSRLSLSPNHGLVCGFTSSGGGQGRSTWIRLLAKAASQCGFRVLTIATLPSPPFMQQDRQEEPQETQQNTNTHMNHYDTSSPFGDEPSMAVANNVLSTPTEVTEKLTGENAQPQVHIPLPGWVWSLERRKQWQSALKQWRNIENTVILVELPPACDPEAVLLAENIPNVIWLSDGGKADASESREQLQTLRDARCNLVGTVMNRAPATARIRKRFSRWVGLWPLLAGICLAAENSRAQTNAPATPASPANVATNEPVFSGSALNRRADWQKRLTLGPGDTLNISMYGRPEFSRLDAVIAPDGRLSYLEATEVVAEGLTVDELRARLDEELGKFHRSPRTIVVPTAYKSKKYYVLGKVVNKGVFTLERPMTILEAVARAQGLETGLLDNQNTFDLADLQRSFIARGNKRLNVNLEKLFLEGDLTQNAAIEPNDYLYFAAANLKEVYVLGEVRIPGPAIHTPNLTVVGAIAARGSYTDKAFKSRVLVVRGSLNQPKTFVVDTWATLDARGLDFRLEPRDIVYVHNRPFIRVEELLDLAATAFIQSATASWANQFIGPIIKNPILPQP
jgi:protein involved in polysaccharide export with SLBB domain/capsular polysaccharide biosynthesis protein